MGGLRVAMRRTIVKRAFFLAGLAVTFPFASPLFAGNELVSLEVRPGVTQKLMVLEPTTSPKGVIVLYAGGQETLDLGTFFGKPVVGNTAYAQNFLVRVREKFVDNGFVAVLPDVPSDRKTLHYRYRLGDLQITDAKASLAYLRSRYAVAPVWLAGTSASSLSVAHVASQIPDAVDRIILTASVTGIPNNYGVHANFPHGTASANLHAIKVPVLVLSNSEDACNLSPSGDSEIIRSGLSNAARVEVKYLSGGDPPRSDPCNALSRHGFLGVEAEAVDSMLGFMADSY